MKRLHWIFICVAICGAHAGAHAGATVPRETSVDFDRITA